MTASARGKVLRRIGDLVERRTRGAGARCSRNEEERYYAGLADKVEAPRCRSTSVCVHRHEPVGVVER
ncbi:hypothetical protein ACU4GR_21500 [Methylobacterium oryzae CBMB20]